MGYKSEDEFRADWAELSKGAQAVIDERFRQFEVEGWTAEHDDQHIDGELATAASQYALHAGLSQKWLGLVSDFGQTYTSIAPLDGWPFEASWWKPKSPREDLVRAAALIIAEIDRLDRKAEAEAPLPEHPDA